MRAINSNLKVKTIVSLIAISVLTIRKVGINWIRILQ